MRQHEFTVDLPHSARRLWALFQRYDLWKEYAPAVLDVEIVYPGDADGNGLLRRVVYPLPFGRRGESFELVKNVRANQGYDYVMLRTGLSGLDDPRAAGPEPDAAPLPRAIPHHEGVVRLARGPDLPLHQQEERAVHARRRGLALGPPRVPPRPDRLTDPRPCLGSERKRACGVGGSGEGRAAAGEAGAAKLTPWESASLRRGPVLSG